MPKKDKKIPEITDYLDEFVDKLLNRIADESEEGRKALVTTMLTAKKLYAKPIESWFTGWFYQYTRTRGREVEQAISSIETFIDAYTRLQEIKILVEKGEWSPNSSFNYYLFVELIKSVPGYKPLETELVHPITIKVKDKIIDKIDIFMYQYKANQKLKESRTKELESTHPSGLKSIENILLANNLQSAQISAKQNPAKIQFCLRIKKNQWILSWVDVTGKTYNITPGDELIRLFIEHNIEDVEKVHTVMAKRIKKECLAARDLFLEKVQLIVNPKDSATHEEISNHTLIAKGISAAFILRGKPNAYSLYWINTLGLVNSISLEAYPQFLEWLNTDSLTAERTPQVKAYLLNVKTSKSISGMDEYKKELEDCLSQGPRKGSTASKSSTVPKEVTHHRLNMSLFAELEHSLKMHHEPVKTKIELNKDTANFSELSVANSEESIAIESIPSLPKVRIKTHLNLDKYAAVSQLFGHKPKVEDTQSIEKSEKPNQPTI